MTDAIPIYKHSAFLGRIGVGRQDITPPVGILTRNWGAAAHDVAEGIHRPLTATALTFQSWNDEPPLILIAMDLGGWGSVEAEWSVRGVLIEALGLEPSRVMINLAHTHAGPGIYLDTAGNGRRGEDLVAPYFDKIRTSVVAAAEQALRSRQYATLTWNSGKCQLAQNRDLPEPYKDRVICGFNPFKKAEDTLLVGRVTDEKGKILATLVNYACHPVTLAWENRQISPDYVGAMREVVEAHTGGAPCLFLQGASGELAPREEYTGNTDVADRNGRQLGFAALSVLEGMLPPQTQYEYAGVVKSGAPLAIWKYALRPASEHLRAISVEFELLLKNMPTTAELDEQLRVCDDQVLAERLRRMKIVRKMVGDRSTLQTHLWAWRVGDSLFLGQPIEAYSQLQIELRRKFPDYAFVVMNLVNGNYGYLVPAELYDLDIYQVRQTPFERGSLEQVIQASEAVLFQLL